MKGVKMKRINKFLGILMVVAMILSLLPSFASAVIPNYDTNDFNKLQLFLNSPSGIAGKTNGRAINSAYNSNNPGTWAGVTWTDSNPSKVSSIGVSGEWNNKLLSGRLDLSDFTELTTLSINGNRIAEFVAVNDNKLTDVEYLDNHTLNISYEHKGGHVYLSSDGNGYVGFYLESFEGPGGITVVGVPEPKSGYIFDEWQNYGELTYDYNRVYLWTDQYTTHTTKALFNTLERPYYTITFDLAGGEHMGDGELVQQVAKYDSAILPYTIKEGFYLRGWDGDYDEVRADAIVTAEWVPYGGSPTSFPEPSGEPSIPPDPTEVPSAKSVQGVFYKVTFDPNGGARVSGGELSQSVFEGTDAVLPLVEYENHKFVRWDTSNKNITGNTTIKAIWEKMYQVTFDMNGGVKTGGGDLVQTVSNGEGAIAPLVERYGYNFTGWHRAFDKITEDTVVAAVWEKNPNVPKQETPEKETFRIVYDINGGSGATPVDTNEYLKGDVALLTDGSGFSKEGYDFAGWSYEVDGDVITEEELTVDTDITLYAVWEESEDLEPAEELVPVIEPTTIPPAEPDKEEEAGDIPKTGEASGFYTGAIMLAFGAGVVVFETVRKRRNVKNDK
jgi:hypothetical protein